jgi:hypothetical protein
MDSNNDTNMDSNNEKHETTNDIIQSPIIDEDGQKTNINIQKPLSYDNLNIDDFNKWENDMNEFLDANKLDVSLVLYRFPRDEIIDDNKKKIWKTKLLSKLKNANFIISFLSYTKTGFELGATEFEKRYDEWANFLGWKIKKEDYFDSSRLNDTVSVTFKGLGGSDDDFINNFGQKLSSDYSHFKRTIDDDGLRSGNIRLFFKRMPIALYLKRDRIFRLGNLSIKYFISFNIVCNHCCLKGHKESNCPFSSLSKLKLENYLLYIHHNNPIFVDVSDVPIEMNILENNNIDTINDLTVLRLYIRAKNERRIRQSKEHTRNQRSQIKSKLISPKINDKGRVS